LNLNQQLNDITLEDFSRKNNNNSKKPDDGFYNLGIAPNLIKEIKRLKFKAPTPIQKESIPTGIQGNDIIAIAQTGSGKTLAFGIPMLQRLSKIKDGIGLVIVPTRELAAQVDESLKTISRSSNIRSVVLIGGASMSLQRNALKKNPRIIIATPGRLMDHIDRRTVKLANVEVFILDEADRMLDMGFVPDIKKIIKSIPEHRQTMLFSATMPKEIEAIAQQLMANPTRFEIDRSGTTPAEVSHEMFLLKNKDKSRLLALQLQECTGPVLVFTRTKHMARKLTIKVNNMGFSAGEIHSNRSLAQRKNALEGFKRGRFQVLIATDIAARGIDVKEIELVVNYDMPANSEDYVHRIGRTGRAGKTGRAVSFSTTEQKSTIRDIERFMKTKFDISALPALPSEKILIKEAAHLKLNDEQSEENKPSKRKSSKNRSSNHQNFNNRTSKRFGKKRTESKQKDFDEKDYKQQDSKHKNSNSNNPRPSIFNPNDFNEEKSYWSNFKKKKRPGKKKSGGKASKRIKRTKRK